MLPVLLVRYVASKLTLCCLTIHKQSSLYLLPESCICRWLLAPPINRYCHIALFIMVLVPLIAFLNSLYTPSCGSCFIVLVHIKCTCMPNINTSFYAVYSISLTVSPSEMEDASCIRLPLHDDPDSAYFAVFDGHGSQRFADYCGEEMHKQLLADSSYGNVSPYHVVYCAMDYTELIMCMMDDRVICYIRFPPPQLWAIMSRP